MILKVINLDFYYFILLIPLRPRDYFKYKIAIREKAILDIINN